MSKTIVISGASGNLGKAAVEKFAASGYTVVALVSPGKTPDVYASSSVERVEADLMDEKSAEAAISKITSTYKTIDAAVLLVGGFAMGNIFSTDRDMLLKMYSLNFETAYFTARPLFAQMSKQADGGRIVFIGARPALRPMDGKDMLAYSLSKSLIFRLSEYLNAEGASKNVVTAVVVPSTLDTPVNRRAMPDADFASWVKPEAVAEILEFITSPKASPIRDTVYKVYGNA